MPIASPAASARRGYASRTQIVATSGYTAAPSIVWPLTPVKRHAAMPIPQPA